jgi:hypothetical protein
MTKLDFLGRQKSGPSASRSGLYERAVQSPQEYRQQGIRSHGYVTSSNTTPQTALVTPPTIWGPTCSFSKNARLSSKVTKG